MKLLLEQEINASAEKVWGILAHQFADVADWTDTLAYSRVITEDEIPNGMTVAPTAPLLGRATPNPLGELIEVLVQYSEDDMQFTFLAGGLPPIVSKAGNTTTVTPKGDDKCIVTFDVEMNFKSIFKLLEPLVRRRILTSKFGPNVVIRELKNYAESL